MNRKQFLIMLVLVAVLGGAGLAMFWQDLSGYQESGAKIGAKVLPNLKAADATEIRIKDAKSEVTLVSNKGSWSVKERGGYPAGRSEDRAVGIRGCFAIPASESRRTGQGRRIGHAA
jgi:hypothetical protein